MADLSRRLRRALRLGPGARALGLGVAFLTALSWLAPGAAADKGLIVDAVEYPWSAIGRVNAAGRSFCTGFLVSERVILTAAHCLYDFRSSRWWPPREVHFVAGYQRDSYLKHSRAKSYEVSRDYTPRRKPAIEHTLEDWAVVTLAEPVGREVGWLGMQSLDRATLRGLKDGKVAAVQAGYRRDRAHALSVGFNCPVPGLFGDGRGILHSCDVVEGGSGSPLLVFRNGHVSVLGIHTMRALGRDGDEYAGALSASIFDPKRGVRSAVTAARAAGLRPGVGAAPASNRAAAPVPLGTIDLLLRRNGYLTKADGRGASGGERKAAIEAFERKQGLRISGKPSITLLGHLIRALR